MTVLKIEANNEQLARIDVDLDTLESEFSYFNFKKIFDLDKALFAYNELELSLLSVIQRSNGLYHDYSFSLFDNYEHTSWYSLDYEIAKRLFQEFKVKIECFYEALQIGESMSLSDSEEVLNKKINSMTDFYHMWYAQFSKNAERIVNELNNSNSSIDVRPLSIVFEDLKGIV